jgi:hypothetical protein
MRCHPDGIPEDVHRFILEHIESVAALEALVLLRRKPDRPWPVGALAAELYVDGRELAPVLARLAAAGLCRAHAGPETLYGWGPATLEDAAMIERLADVYARHLIPVTHLIHAKPHPSGGE